MVKFKKIGVVMNKNQISLQVYTARNFKPYEDIFKFLSDSGLENVELFEVEAFDETKQLLEKYNLTARSSHIGFDTLKNTKEIISSLQKLNVKHAIDALNTNIDQKTNFPCVDCLGNAIGNGLTISLKKLI